MTGLTVLVELIALVVAVSGATKVRNPPLVWVQLYGLQLRHSDSQSLCYPPEPCVASGSWRSRYLFQKASAEGLVRKTLRAKRIPNKLWDDMQVPYARKELVESAKFAVCVDLL